MTLHKKKIPICAYKAKLLRKENTQPHLPTFFPPNTLNIPALRARNCGFRKKQDVSSAISAWNEQWVGQISAWGQMFKADWGHIELRILTNTGFFLKTLQNVTENPTADQQA